MNQQDMLGAGLAMLSHILFQLHSEETIQEALDNALSDLGDGDNEEENALFASTHESFTMGNQEVERLK